MLRLAGVRLHPGVRTLIGGALVAVGLIGHTGPGIVVVGAALVAWGAIDVLARR